MKRRSNGLTFFLALVLFVTVVGAALYVRQGAVRPHELSRMLTQADRVVVRESPWDHAPLLYESSDRADLDALRRALQVERPDRFRHCMCDGTPAIFLYAGDRLLGQFTNHHGKLIRCSLWMSDAPIVDPEPLLTWFDDRKISAPRQEYEESRRQR